ncbi:MAG: hypothetical protein ACLS9K_10900 [Lachnospira eligens]
MLCFCRSACDCGNKYIPERHLDGRKRNTTANVIISVCIMVFFVYSLSAVKDVSTSKLGIKVVGAIMHGITHPDWEYMFMTGKSGVMYLGA